MAKATAVRGFRYNAYHFAAIEKSLGNKYRLSDEQKARIAWAATDFNLDEKIFKPTPGAPAQLKKIQDLSDKLCKMIAGNDPALLGSELHEEALEVLFRIMIVQAPVKLGKGRMPEESREKYILKMADIYKDITGRKAGYSATGNEGPFSRFLRACLATALPEMCSGLQKAIEVALTGRK